MPLARRTTAVLVAIVAAFGGTASALHYYHAGLSLSHYDARGHLVVARRIFDSLTPGWQQIGAVWLPLPHLLNALPVQVDLFYRTGASAIAISILSYAVATAAIAWIVESITTSRWAGVAGALVLAINPNVLYLQATPMTEPLLIALTLSAIAALMAWIDGQPKGCPYRDTDATSVRTGLSLSVPSPQPPAPSPRVVGALFAFACMTRYEAWPVTATACALAVWALWRGGDPLPAAVRNVLRVAIYPIVAVAAFFIFSRIVVGSWFANDFFVPENPAQGLPYEVLKEIVWGTRSLSGLGVLIAGAAGLALLAGVGLLRDRSARALLPLALLAVAAVPAAAFFDGHPYRIRYMVPLLAAQAVGAGIVAGLLVWLKPEPIAKRRWAQLIMVPVILVLAIAELHPFDASAAMVAEAQWDRPNIAGRAPVTTCLADGYHGETVMASMGSLGHYMQDLSAYGFQLHDFLHEGNGDIWLGALERPAAFAGWLMIEEKAEGGDMLAHIARENPSWLDGFSRVCEGAGVALYRRRPPSPNAL